MGRCKDKVTIISITTVFSKEAGRTVNHMEISGILVRMRPNISGNMRTARRSKKGMGLSTIRTNQSISGNFTME